MPSGIYNRKAYGKEQYKVHTHMVECWNCGRRYPTKDYKCPKCKTKNEDRTVFNGVYGGDKLSM